MQQHSTIIAQMMLLNDQSHNKSKALIYGHEFINL